MAPEKPKSQGHEGQSFQPSEKLARLMLELEGWLPEERRLEYREHALLKLVEYLNFYKLTIKSVNPRACRLITEVETIDGISFLFDVGEGNMWEVGLPRKESCRSEIHRDPKRIKDESLFIMDLATPAKVMSRNADCHH